MQTQDIRAMLHYPDSGLVQYALGKVNLSSDEWTIIKMREYENNTIERVAEKLDVSTRTVDYRYKSAIDKLNRCWSATQWVQSVIKS